MEFTPDLRVLHVIPSVESRSGGPAEAIFPMCRALKKEGIEILLATTNAGIDAKTVAVPATYKEVPTVFFPVQFGASFKFSKLMSGWLNQNVGSFDVVHIHAIFNHACVAAAKACRKQRVPYVIRPLGTLDPWSLQQKRFRKQVFWRLSGRKMLEGAAAVHYTTRAEQKIVEESLGLNHGLVVPLGVDSDDSVCGVSSTGVNKPYVLFLSRLHPKKGVDVLIDAFLEVVKEDRFSEWRLVVAGDGPPDYVDLLREKIFANDAARWVYFTGWLEGQEKRRILKGAALLALPSLQENFGLCVAESLAAGVPVLISPQVNLADDIRAASAGWISEVTRLALQRALRDALSNPAERNKRGSAGRILSASFTWSRVAADWKHFYSSIVLNQNAADVS